MRKDRLLAPHLTISLFTPSIANNLVLLCCLSLDPHQFGMSKPYRVVAFESISNQLATYKQRGNPLSEFVAVVGGDVYVGDFVKFCTLTCTPPPFPDGRTIMNDFLCVRSIVGQMLVYFLAICVVQSICTSNKTRPQCV
jgi:hypothetical protein